MEGSIAGLVQCRRATKWCNSFRFAIPAEANLRLEGLAAGMFGGLEDWKLEDSWLVGLKALMASKLGRVFRSLLDASWKRNGRLLGALSR